MGSSRIAKPEWVAAAGAAVAWVGALSLAAQTPRTPAPAAPARAAAGPSQGWPGYGGGPAQIRYSSLTQINKTNVSKLAVAWTYDTGEAGAMQTQPIVVDDVLYGYTPTHKAFAAQGRHGRAALDVRFGYSAAADPIAA